MVSARPGRRLTDHRDPSLVPKRYCNSKHIIAGTAHKRLTSSMRALGPVAENERSRSFPGRLRSWRAVVGEIRIVPVFENDDSNINS